MLGFAAKVAAAPARCKVYGWYGTGAQPAKVRRILYAHRLNLVGGALGAPIKKAMLVQLKLRCGLCAVQSFAKLMSHGMSRWRLRPFRI